MIWPSSVAEFVPVGLSYVWRYLWYLKKSCSENVNSSPSQFQYANGILFSIHLPVPYPVLMRINFSISELIVDDNVHIKIACVADR